MQSKEDKLAIEIKRCESCIRTDESTEDKCQQWIRTNNKINRIPDMLIKKNSSKINIVID
jgi:hypothetical protein